MAEEPSPKTALVTGASSGIGEATAILLKQNGYTVYGAARTVDRMKELEEKGIHVIALDITQDESCHNCIDTIIGREGSVDILVNNAGYGSYGAIEDVELEEARRQFEVNLFGLARLTKLVLPKMRGHGFGKIVNISSIAGKMSVPFGGWYHASKHALESWSDALRLETEPFGIDVVIIEPGAIKTHFGDIAIGLLSKTSGSGPYAEAAKKMADRMTNMLDASRMSDPSVIADLVLKAITAPRPKARYHGGYMATPVLLLRRLLPDRAFDWVIKFAG
ncbi:MAG: oxidoreductase [Hyphomicrobiales bacterium]